MKHTFDTVAQTLARHSIECREGEKVLVEASDDALPLAEALIKAIREAGGYPLLNLLDTRLIRTWLESADEKAVACWRDQQLELLRGMDAYVGLDASRTSYTLSGISGEAMSLYCKAMGEIRRTRCAKKWCKLYLPTDAMAQQAQMDRAQLDTLFFDCCSLDYARMTELALPLENLMKRTDQVHITAPNTDLTFSIKGRYRHTAICGAKNLPDGEVGTDIVPDSVYGRVHYTVPSTYQGRTFRDICLTFEKGRIVDAEADDTLALNAILDTDPGARYIGEFSLGINPAMTRSIGNTLFDEKMAGSFHFTPGYDSAIHWDLICQQLPPDGAGEIWFDGQLVRRDGLFVPDFLLKLNPRPLWEALRGEGAT